MRGFTMSISEKPRIRLPQNPETYYGFSTVVSELKKGYKLYIGSGNRVDEMIVEDVCFNENLNSYEIHTNIAVLLANSLTRVAYSLNHITK